MLTEVERGGCGEVDKGCHGTEVHVCVHACMRVWPSVRSARARSFLPSLPDNTTAAPLARFESGRARFVTVVVGHVVVLGPRTAVVTPLQAPRVGPVPIIHVVWAPNIVRGDELGRTEVVFVPLVAVVSESTDEAASLGGRAKDSVGKAAAQALAGTRL